MADISPNSTAKRRILRLAVVGAFVFLSVASGTAYIATRGPSTRGVAELQSSITEFRGYALVQWGLEDDIWRLASDSRATMVYTRRGGHRECDEGGGCQGSDAGTWSRSGDQICVDWQTRREISGCYTIMREAGIHVRLVGPVTFEGTLEAD